MSYFDLLYAFLFLPVVVLVYNLTPKKFRKIILLLASYIFFYLYSCKLVVFLLLSTLSIYGGALWMGHIDKLRDNELENTDIDKKEIKKKYKRRKRYVLLLVLLFNISFLFFFKYLNFFKINLNLLFSQFDISYNFKIVKHLAPIGISFYTLSALSYVIDVYNEKIKADKNVLRVGLFLSFFPTIVEGPIVRYTDTAESLYSGNTATYDNFCNGYIRIFYGLFKKYVIADRLNIFVKLVFANFATYSGLTIALSVIAYTILLYMEFSGTMDVVIGSANIFGVNVPENFKQPFFAKTIQEFWMRWHITLGSWFKDYIFYPISLSKPVKKLTMKTRKVFGNHYGILIPGMIALFAVWSLNGLWHGAGYTYLFFGMYHFVIISIGNFLGPVVVAVCNKLKINRSSIIYKVLQNIKLIILVLIGELFFRSPTVAQGFAMLKRIFLNFTTFRTNEFFTFGLDLKDVIVLVLALIVILVVSILKEKGVNVREAIKKKNIVLRWTIYYALILSIIVFGAFGSGYVPVDPIYADF